MGRQAKTKDDLDGLTPLRRLRLTAKIRLMHVAAVSGIDATYLSKLETGQMFMGEKSKGKLLEAYKSLRVGGAKRAIEETIAEFIKKHGTGKQNTRWV